MPDMLVKLYKLPETEGMFEQLAERGISLKRAFAADTERIVSFVRENFNDGWAGECRYACVQNPPSCYVAVKDREIVGFACFDVTAKNFFGPVGVLESERGSGVGKALLLRCLQTMREMGYAYAIIGWVEEPNFPFYEKTVGASIIPDSFPGAYRNKVDIE